MNYTRPTVTHAETSTQGPQRTTRWTRWASLAGLLWISGCVDLCSGMASTAVVNEQVALYRYSSEAVAWPHVRAVLLEHQQLAVFPEQPPPRGEWAEVGPVGSPAVQLWYRVRFNPALTAEGVHLVIESSMLTGGRRFDYSRMHSAELDVLRRVDPERARALTDQQRQADEQVTRGCTTGLSMGCAVINACDVATGGGGCRY